MRPYRKLIKKNLNFGSNAVEDGVFSNTKNWKRVTSSFHYSHRTKDIHFLNETVDFLTFSPRVLSPLLWTESLKRSVRELSEFWVAICIGYGCSWRRESEGKGWSPATEATDFRGSPSLLILYMLIFCVHQCGYVYVSVCIGYWQMKRKPSAKRTCPQMKRHLDHTQKIKKVRIFFFFFIAPHSCTSWKVDSVNGC